MGFLLKYSIEKGWISPAVRVIIGLLSATTLLGVSEFLVRRFKQWAFGCIAGSIVLYYISFYAAHFFYHLISLPLVFGAFAGTTALVVGAALRHDSYVMAIFSVIGGFATPFLLHLHENPEFLFLAFYLFTLALGFLAISYLRHWYFLSFVSFIGLALNYARFFDSKITPNTILLFMLGWFLVYSVFPYLYALGTKRKSSFEAWLIPLCAAITFIILRGEFTRYVYQATPSAFDTAPAFLAFLFQGQTSVYIAKILALIFGGYYLVSLIVLFFRDKENLYLTGSLFVLSFFFFFTAIMVQWQGVALCGALGIFAALIFLLGVAMRSFFIRFFSYLAWLISVGVLFSFPFSLQEKLFSPVWNSLNASFAIIFLMFLLAAVVGYKQRDVFERKVKDALLPFAPDILASGAILTVVYWLYSPVWAYPYHLIALVWYAFGLIILGLVLPRLLRAFGYGIVCLAVLNFLYVHDALLTPIWYAEYMALIASYIVISGAVLLIVQRYGRLFFAQELPVVRSSVISAIAFFLFLGMRAQLIITYGQPAVSAVHEPGEYNYLNMLLTVYYGLYALALIVAGFFTRQVFVRYFGLVLMALVLGKLWFLIMAMHDTGLRIVAFIIIGLVLTLASFVYQKMSRK